MSLYRNEEVFKVQTTRAWTRENLLEACGLLAFSLFETVLFLPADRSGLTSASPYLKSDLEGLPFPSKTFVRGLERRKAGVPRALMLYVELKGSLRQTSHALKQLQSAIVKIEAELPKEESVRHVQAIVAFAQETPASMNRKRQDDFRRLIHNLTGHNVSLKFRAGASLANPADLRELLPNDWLS